MTLCAERSDVPGTAAAWALIVSCSSRAGCQMVAGTNLSVLGMLAGQATSLLPCKKGSDKSELICSGLEFRCQGTTLQGASASITRADLDVSHGAMCLRRSWHAELLPQHLLYQQRACQCRCRARLVPPHGLEQHRAIRCSFGLCSPCTTLLGGFRLQLAGDCFSQGGD